MIQIMYFFFLICDLEKLEDSTLSNSHEALDDTFRKLHITIGIIIITLLNSLFTTVKPSS